MVALISKTEIEAKNIDTVEKAIAFGALVLRSALIGADNSQANNRKVSLRISPSREPPSYLSIDIYIPYDAYQFNTSGGLALQSLGELTSNSLSLEADLSLTSQPSNSSLIIPEYNEAEIDTFEKYIFYYAQILWASVEEKRNNIIKINPQGNQDNPEFFIDLSLPINLDIWLFGKNYLDALESAVTNYVTSFSLGGQNPGRPPETEFNLYVTDPEGDEDYEIFTFPFPGTLLSVEFYGDFADEDNSDLVEFYVDGEYVDFDLVTTGGYGYPSFSWSSSATPLFVAPEAILYIYIDSNDLPTYLDVYVRVAPLDQGGQQAPP